MTLLLSLLLYQPTRLTNPYVFVQRIRQIKAGFPKLQPQQSQWTYKHQWKTSPHQWISCLWKIASCLDFLLLLRIVAVILHELFFSVLTAANHQAGKIAQAAWTELVCDLTPLHNSFRSHSGVTLHRTSSKEFGGYRQSQGIILCHGREKWEWTGVQSPD